MTTHLEREWADEQIVIDTPITEARDCKFRTLKKQLSE
jgi:hypothetical protein